MRNLLLSLILLVPSLCFLQGKASTQDEQQFKIDSLQLVLKTTQIPDSSKCRSYVDLIKLYKKTDTDSCRAYLEKLLQYAKTNNSNLAYHHYYRLKAGYFGLFPESGDNTTDFINSNLLEALAYSKKAKDPKLIFEIYARLTQENARLGKEDDALLYAKEGEKISIENGLWKETAYIYGQLGKLYNLGYGRTEEALQYLLKSDSIYSLHNYEGYRRGFTLSFIGDVYESFDNLEEAISYHEKALAIFEISNNVYQQKFILGKLALVESKRKNYEKAIPYVLDAIAYYQDNKYPMQQATFLVVLSDIYCKSGQIQKALEAGQSAIDLSKNKNYDAGLVMALITQSTTLNANKSFLKSNQLALEAEVLAIEMDGYLELVEIYNLLSLNYESLGNYQQAFQYSKDYRRVNDTLVARKNTLKAKELEAKYKSEKKEQEIALLKTESELKEQKQKSERNLLLGGLGITTLVGLLLFILFRNRQKTNNKLRELDRLKSNFFTNISHEFRTPLTLISNPIEEAIEDETVSDKKREQFKVAKQSSDRLLALINQVLDLSKIEDGKLKLHIQKGNVMPFIAAMANSFSYSAEKKKIDYQVSIIPYDHEFYVDKDIVEKTIVNLLSNAIKYTPENNQIQFTAKIVDNTLKIDVKNSGSQVSKSELQNIFKRFYQTHEDRSGSGIGLALVKELVTLHKGTISASTNDNGWICFDVELPVDKNSFKDEDIHMSKASDDFVIPVTTEESDAIEDSTLDGNLPILLIVEDNADIRNLINNLFNSRYQVLTATNGKEGIEKAIAHVPDMIISDVMMPIEDGISLTKTLKNDERTSHIPIVLLTAKAGDHNELFGIEVGADDYITKPFNSKILSAKVDKLIESRRLLQERYSREIVLKPIDVVVNDVEAQFFERIQGILSDKLSDDTYSIELLSTDMGMSRMQLHRKLKAITGLSASEFLRSQRLKHATSLLKTTQSNIAEIAYAVGFNDASYFTKSFKDIFGCSPTEFRNRA